MPYFDFHCHPGLKPHLSPRGEEPSPWLDVQVQLELLHSIRINISSVFADSLDSQASLGQLWRGGVNLIGLVIHSIEKDVAGGLLGMGIVRNGSILQLDPGKLAASAKGDHYYAIAREELQALVDNSRPASTLGFPAGTQLKFIRSMAEYDRNDRNTIHALLILEGAQNLLDNPTAADAPEQFLRNLDDLSRSFRVFAINLCHFQQQPIANQAFAMQVLKDLAPFYPTGRGISEWGMKAIKDMYARGILLDIKHLSWYTRRELYRMRQEEGIQLPLICSHAGVTGISANDRLNYFYHDSPIDEGSVWKVHFLKKWGHVKDTAYNMASLQLYDEEIEQIIFSDGIIGISLDQRIIGFPGDEPLLYKEQIYPTDMDCISKGEADVFFGPTDPATLPPGDADNERVMNYDDGANQQDGDTAYLHALYFLNQALHILWVAKTSKRGLKLEDALTRICIGSDLDGLINPIDCCTNATRYTEFKELLLDVLEKDSFWRGTGFSAEDFDVPTFIEGIFFENAFAFLNKWFR